MTRNGKNGCPSQDCSGGKADRQNEITDGQLNHIPHDIKEIIQKHGTASRCNYCGCVYIKDISKDTIIKLGFLDNSMYGEGWH